MDNWTHIPETFTWRHMKEIMNNWWDATLFHDRYKNLFFTDTYHWEELKERLSEERNRNRKGNILTQASTAFVCNLA